MTALSVMRLIEKQGKIVDGTIVMNDQELLTLRDRQIASIRGKDMAMIFQEPMTALNPVFTIGNQISEVLVKHKKISKQAARKQAVELLDMVGITRAKDIYNKYPHQ